MDIKNFKLKDFLKQPEHIILEYSSILKHLEPVQTKNQIQDLTLREVETIKQGINDPDNFPEVFKFMQGLEQDEMNNLKIVEFYSLLNDIVRQIQNLVRMEEQELISEHTDIKWEAVDGSKRLSVLGILPMLDGLAGGDILKYEQVLDLPYLTVFNHLRLKRIQSDIEKDMSKLNIKQE